MNTECEHQWQDITTYDDQGKQRLLCRKCGVEAVQVKR